MALESLIEKFNKDNSKALDKIEKILEPSRQAIQNGAKLMLKIDPKNIAKVDDFQKQVASHKALIAEYYYQLCGLVKNKKAAYMVLLKNKAEAENQKFVAAAAEAEANLAVADERRLRDKLQGSFEAATELIRTCRNIKNNDESKYSGKEETE
jgi:Xaa-Pro aminopeptidase